jgi:16S rRNA (uracil1498-N3)-methyltransferase
VSGEPYHHLVHVLRARVGNTVELFDGHGRACEAVIESIEESRALLRLGRRVEKRLERSLTLLQGLPKGEKWEWILQKGTELGASRFVPLTTARTIVKLDPAKAAHRQERWSKVVQEAARQCGRADVPEIWPLQTLSEALRRLSPGTTSFVLDEEERAMNLRRALAPLDPSVPLAFSVGPEGGWERDEIAMHRSHGATPVTLGTRVLRTETAALAVLAMAGFLSLPE